MKKKITIPGITVRISVFKSYCIMLCMLLYMTLCAGLESTESCNAFFFCVLTYFFIQSQHLTKSSMNSAFLHCLWTHKFHFSVICSLKMDPTTLFTHLKIILLQCFQFQFSVSATINSIQTDPIYDLML